MPIPIPQALSDVQSVVKSGKETAATVRTLLEWYHAKRRGSWIVSIIRGHLKELNLATVPDFEYEYIDAMVKFVKVDKPEGKGGVAAPKPTASPDAQQATVTTAGDATGKPVAALKHQDPSYSIRKLEAANRVPVSVAPDKPIAEAVTLMLSRDFSQLPVMQGERKVLGLFSWQSIGSTLALGNACTKVSEAMEPVPVVSSEASIFQVAEILSREAVVLVQASATDPKITGIVTTADLAEQFGNLGEPFLLLGQIENHLRGRINVKFTKEELQAAKDPRDADRTIEGAADMTFGEYVRLLEEPGRWKKCMDGVDRGIFIEMLKRTGTIRNDVMHFDPDGIDPTDLDHLRAFTAFLDRLTKLKK